jgi:flagellar hook-associated protein 2
MATTTAVGGSQIDVAGLVSQLVAAERAPLDKQVTRDANRVTTQISAVAQLMGAMSSFRASLSSLKTVDVFSTRGATSGNDEIFTATAGASAVPGAYEVEVQELASAHQLSSNAFANGSSHVVGTGALTLSLGTESFSLDIDSSNNTLAGIRDAINGASDNPGIRATLISGAGGSRLVLTSANTGAANAITVSQGGGGGLALLTYSAGSPGNYAQIAEAKDARVRIANATITSATNTITNAIDGVTLNLHETNALGETDTLTVSYDKSAVTSRVNNFVAAYNQLQTLVTKLRGYDAATKTAGPMLGDSLITGIESQLRRTITDAVPAAGNTYQTLASIGITTQANGQLQVDTAKLTKALDTNFEAVGQLFGSEQGVGAKLFAQMDDRLKTDGALDTRSKNLVEQQKAIENRKLQIDSRMATLQQGYLKQFTRLDTLLSSLQVTSSYLTQQIESLGNLNKASSR